MKKEQKSRDINGIMIDNFVALQKVMTNLSIKLDELANKISKLLELFEISAKVLAEKDFNKAPENKKIEEKINVLLEQNKTIAKGLALVHERMPEENSGREMENFEEPEEKSDSDRVAGKYQRSIPVGKSSFSSVREANVRQARKEK